MWILGVILHSLYYISPAYAANAFAVFGGGTPIDFGRSWRGQRILGDGKTWRGLLIGMLASILFALFWFYMSKSGPLNAVYYDVFDFRMTDPFFGLYLGFGALFGDLVESFIKRRIGKARGSPWWGFDQLDHLFGALLFAYLFAPTFIIWEEFIALIILSVVIHLLGNQIAFYTHTKKVRW
jgi:CDP-2,3-bis-(O-geranylgeranyl)-sn-glycerol synthase